MALAKVQVTPISRSTTGVTTDTATFSVTPTLGNGIVVIVLNTGGSDNVAETIAVFKSAASSVVTTTNERTQLSVSLG